MLPASMAVRYRLRPPRQMLAVFLGVALVSAGALGWLGWLLLQQDAALESQRRRDSLEQAADRALVTMQLAMAELQAVITSTASVKGNLPPGASRISIGPDGVTAWPEGSIPYFPFARAAQPEPLQAFADGERSEFALNDLHAAARAYARAGTAAEPIVRAGGLARLARVGRKRHDTEAALRAYGQLATIDADVDGIPAALVARAGRASLFEEVGHVDRLRQEAAALDRDLRQGRWRLTKSEYDFYSNQASAWMGATRTDDRDARARADALEWLWQNHASLDGTVRRAMALPGGPALVIGQASRDRLDVIVAGADYFASLCARSVPADLGCELNDPEGRALVGDRHRARDAAVRAASANGLPWTLHVSAASNAAATASSSRRRLLILAFGVVGLVLAAGWYFILRAMSRELRASRLQSEFVAAVSHEFRSPLTSLSHIADLLATDRLPSDVVRRRSYDVLVRDTDRLQRLVEDLLDFGRFEAGAAALRLETLDVAGLVQTTVSDFRQHVVREGYSVELTGADDEMPVRADREAIARALWNLLDNAVKYSPECKTVWVTLERRDTQILIVVRDRGLGIPVHEQREIFDRFVRGAESTARRIRGTGIGLAMVRQIVRAHGGEIRVVSEPGKGSTFTTVLPSVQT